MGEPLSGEFSGAVGHVAPAKDAQGQHLGRGQLRLETGGEVLAHRLGQGVGVALLHEVVDNNESVVSHDRS